MELFARSAPLRIAVVVVIALVVQYVTHTSWLGMTVLVTYFVAKEVAGIVLGVAPAAALLAAEPRLRIGAWAFDNLAFIAAVVGLFMQQKVSFSEGSAVARFAVFELAVIVFVAAWAVIAGAAIRRAGLAKV